MTLWCDIVAMWYHCGHYTLNEPLLLSLSGTAAALIGLALSASVCMADRVNVGCCVAGAKCLHTG